MLTVGPFSFTGGELLGAGSRILGGLFGRSSRRRAERQAAGQFERQMNFAEDMRDRRIQRTVADANKAGIHPLYALGASQNVSAPTFIAGQHGSGSGLGTGLAEAAGALGRSLAGKRVTPVQDAQIKMFGAQIEESNARASLARAEADSIRKRTEQQVNEVRTFPLPSARIPKRKLSPPMTLVWSKKGRGWTPSRTTPAEVYEEEYGDLGGSLLGGARFLGDMHDLFRHWVRHGRAGPRAKIPGWRFKDNPGGAVPR